MSGLLAAAYSQVYALAVELSVCTRLDPRSLDVAAVVRNAGLLAELEAILLPRLRRQNDRACSALSLELVHLLENSREASAALLAPGRKGTRVPPLRTPSVAYSVEFYGGHKVDVSLCLINDIEILMKRINSVFYCMSHTMGLESLERALDLLGRFRGVSPIPDPRLYITSVPCWRCVGELMVLPNHGNPSTAEGTHVSCNHLAVPVNPEPVSGLFENEVRQAGLGHLLEAEEKARPGGPEEGAVPGPGRPEAEGATRALDTYNVFSTVPPEVAELSELLYWNSGGHAIGATGQGEGGGHSRLSALFARERRLALVRGACEEALAGARLTHLFDAVAPGATERLFCGGVYSSSGDAVEALKADCAAAFTAHPQYRAIRHASANQLSFPSLRALQPRRPVPLLLGHPVSLVWHAGESHGGRDEQRASNVFDLEGIFREYNFQAQNIAGLVSTVGGLFSSLVSGFISFFKNPFGGMLILVLVAGVVILVISLTRRTRQMSQQPVQMLYPGIDELAQQHASGEGPGINPISKTELQAIMLALHEQNQEQKRAAQRAAGPSVASRALQAARDRFPGLRRRRYHDPETAAALLGEAETEF